MSLVQDIDDLNEDWTYYKYTYRYGGVIYYGIAMTKEGVKKFEHWTTDPYMPANGVVAYEKSEHLSEYATTPVNRHEFICKNTFYLRLQHWKSYDEDSIDIDFDYDYFVSEYKPWLKSSKK